MTLPPLPGSSTPTLSPDQRRGRALLLVIFVVYVLIDVSLMAIGLDGSFSWCVRVSLSITLMYAVWIGQRWAHWLMVALMYAASVLMLVAAVIRPHPLLLSMLVLIALPGSLVGFSKDVSSFLHFQREKK